MEKKELKILIIDDNQDIIDQLQNVLSDSFPHAVLFSAANGREGIAVALEEDPDTILLDIVMPGMDGFEVCRQLKESERLKHIPVAFLTAIRTDRISRILALEAGAEAFLSKPVEETELVAQIRLLVKLKEANILSRQQIEHLADLVSDRTQDLERELAEHRKDKKALEFANRQLRENQVVMQSLLDNIKAEVDIRKQVESQLLREREFTRSLLENVGDGVIACDTDGKIVLFNKVAREWHGADYMDLPQERWAEALSLFSPDGSSPLTPDEIPLKRALGGDMIRDAHLSMIAKSQPLRYITANGNPFYDVHGCALGAVVVMRDITELKRIEKELRESERRADEMIRNLPGFVYRCANDRQWTMEYISEGCKQITGYAAQDLLNNRKVSFNDIIHPDFRETIWHTWQESLSRKEPFEGEYPILTADGKMRWLWERGRGIFSDENKLLFLEGFIADVTVRKEAEEAIREYEFKFRTMADHTADWEYWQDPHGKFLYISPSCEQISGYSPEEFFHDDTLVEKIIFPEDLSRTRKHFQQHTDLRMSREGGKAHFRIVHRSGDIRWIEHSCRPVMDEKGRHLGQRISNRDVTERMIALEEIRSNEVRLQSVANILQYQAETIQEFIDFALCEAVKLTESQLGYIFYYQDEQKRFVLNACSSAAKHQFIAVTLSETGFPPKMTTAIEETGREHLPVILNDLEVEIPTRNEEEEEEERLILHRALIFPILAGEESPAVICVANKERDYHGSDIRQLGLLMGAVWRVVEQRKAEEAWRNSEERFRHAFQNANVGMCLLNPQGQFQRINPKMCEMLGYTNEELEKLSIYDICDVQSQENDVECIRQALSGTVDRATFEFRFLHKDGPSVWGQVSSSLIRDTQEKDFYCIFHILDITGRKQGEDRLKLALKEKETLLQELYHRTKNNMQVICSLLRLQSTYMEDAEVKNVFRDMESRIYSMALVHRKLYESQNLSSINLSEYIRELADLLIQSYQFGPTSVSLSLDLEDVFVLIDTAVPCGLILNELISNAIRHAFPKGKPGNIQIRLRRLPDGSIELMVADDGVGVPKDFDFRSSGKLGLQSIFAIGEYQLRAKVDFHTDKGVGCSLCFRDTFYQPRV